MLPIFSTWNADADDQHIKNRNSSRVVVKKQACLSPAIGRAPALNDKDRWPDRQDVMLEETILGPSLLATLLAAGLRLQPTGNVPPPVTPPYLEI